jgi:Fe-S-cluster containining protein
VIVAADEIQACHTLNPGLRDLIVPLKRYRYAMKGTEGRHKRCAGLKGIVGQTVCCTVYESRPATCRGFQAAWELDTVNPKCDLARAAYGLYAFGLF